MSLLFDGKLQQKPTPPIFFLFKNICRVGGTSVLFIKPQISLFRISGDVCHGFQSQGSSPCLYALLLVHEGFLRFLQGATPANLLVTRIAAKPLWHTCFFKHWWTQNLDLMSLNEFSGGSRIFPRGVCQLSKLLLFFKFLPKTAWKWKNLDPRGGASLAPPLGSANGISLSPFVTRFLQKVCQAMLSVRLLDNFDKKWDVLRNTTFHIIRNTKFVNVWHFHFWFPNARTKQD